MSTMYPSKFLSDFDFLNPDVYWQGSIAKSATKTITTTKRPRMIVYFNTRSDNQYRHACIWDEVRQKGVFFFHSSKNGVTSLTPDNLSSGGWITAVTDSSFSIKSVSTGVTYYYNIYAWY